MVRKWAIIVLWGAVELFSDKHQRSNVLLCRGTGIYWDIGTGSHKFWQMVHTKGQLIQEPLKLWTELYSDGGLALVFLLL